MSRSHAALVLEIDPGAAGKTLTLNPNGEISDPIGSDLTAYRETAAQMRPLIEKRLSEKQII